LLTSRLLISPSAHLEVLWHLSTMLCRNPRRTNRKPAAGGNRPRGICARRTNTWRDWWRRAAPTNGPVVVEQLSTPAAGRPPLQVGLRLQVSNQREKGFTSQTIELNFKKPFVP